MVRCIVCEKEFNQRHPRYICCSSECSKKRREETIRIYKKENNERKMKLVHKYKIPKVVIEKYGEENIIDNEFLLETLQVINRISGKWYLSDEDRQIRKRVNKEQTIYKRKLESAIEKVCDNCGKVYTKLELGRCVRNTVCCSKECSKERRRAIDIVRKREWNEKQKIKKQQV